MNFLQEMTALLYHEGYLGLCNSFISLRSELVNHL